MKPLFITAVLLAGLSLGVAFAQNFDFPSNPTVDQIVTGPAGQGFKWDGAKWVAMLGGGGGGGSSIAIGPTPPPTPAVGQYWFDPTNLQTYMWYADPTSSQWIAVVNLVGGGGGTAPLIGPTAPANPSAGQLWFDTTNVQMYIWYSSGTSSQWAPVTHP